MSKALENKLKELELMINLSNLNPAQIKKLNKKIKAIIEK
jgi:hypothetical protein